MYLTTFFLHHLHLSCHTAVGTPPSVVSPRLAANAVGSPSFSYLEYRNCSAAVLIAEVSFSLNQLMRSAGGGCGRFVRLSSVSEGAVSNARARMIVSCTGPPNVDSAIPTSTTSRTSVAAAVARLKKMSSSTPGSHGELPLDHAAAGLAVFGGGSALRSGPGAA